MTQKASQKYLYHITNVDISQFNLNKLGGFVGRIVSKELYTFDDLDIAKSHFAGIGSTPEESFKYYSLADSLIMPIDELCTDINAKLPENVSVSPDLLKKLPVGRKITLEDIVSVFNPLPIEEDKRSEFSANKIKQQIEIRKKGIMALSQVFKDKTLKLGTKVPGIQFEGYPQVELTPWVEYKAEQYNINFQVINSFIYECHRTNEKTPFTKEKIRQIYEKVNQNASPKEIEALYAIFEGKNFKLVDFFKSESRRILRLALKPEAKIILQPFPLRFSGIKTVPDKAIYTLLGMTQDSSGKDLVERVLNLEIAYKMFKPVERRLNKKIPPISYNFLRVYGNVKRNATVSEMLECIEKEGQLAFARKYGFDYDNKGANYLRGKINELKALKETYDEFSQKLGSDTARKLGIIDDEALQQKAMEVVKAIVLYERPAFLGGIFQSGNLQKALIEMGVAGSRMLSVYASGRGETKGNVYHIWDLNAVHIEEYMNKSTNMQWQPVSRPPEQTLDKKQEKPHVDLLRQMGAIGGYWR